MGHAGRLRMEGVLEGDVVNGMVQLCVVGVIFSIRGLCQKELIKGL